MGSQELYRWLDEEPQLFCPADVDYVHSPERISRMKHVISINGGVELDLMGQENAESAGSRQLSGTGGQLDFLEGAFRSEGGKGFICLASTHRKKGRHFKIQHCPLHPGPEHGFRTPNHDPVRCHRVRRCKALRPVSPGES